MALPTANLIAPPIVDADVDSIRSEDAQEGPSSSRHGSPPYDPVLLSPTDTIAAESGGDGRFHAQQALSDDDRCHSSKTLVGWCGADNDEKDEAGVCLDLKHYQLFDDGDEKGDVVAPIQDAGTAVGWSSASSAIAAAKNVQENVRRRLSSTAQSMSARPQFGARAQTPVPAHKRGGSDDYLEMDDMGQVPTLPAVSVDQHHPEDAKAGDPPPFQALGSTVSRISALSRQPLTPRRKYLLLGIFSCAQFLDIFAGSGALIALADIEESLKMPTAMGTWVINAYAIGELYRCACSQEADKAVLHLVSLCVIFTFGELRASCSLLISADSPVPAQSCAGWPHLRHVQPQNRLSLRLRHARCHVDRLWRFE